MTQIKGGEPLEYHVIFYCEGEIEHPLFKGEFLEVRFDNSSIGKNVLMVGLGKDLQERNQIKEVCAIAVREMKKYNIKTFSCEALKLMNYFGEDSLGDIIEGLILGGYVPEHYPPIPRYEYTVILSGIEWGKGLDNQVREMITLVRGVMFARDMVNMPANTLRPEDFAREIITLVEGFPVETVIITKEQIRDMGMNGLLTVGDSSTYPPCLLVLRYMPVKDGSITALVGKGVTCDTGGYCVKPGSSMEGIKGDMAGGAAVAGAVYALAANRVQQNVVAVIPMCENKIAPWSFIPGDVITSYNGTTIEVLNTDAEGRLILADAISYAIQNERADRILDIATLTGAVANTLGNGVAGTLAQGEEFYRSFSKAFETSGERYHRLPWYREHEGMIKSDIADIKNVGGDHSGTITAGLFLRHFVEDKPWIHLDIAGTASVWSPLFTFQSKGATGIGVTTIYHMCKEMLKKNQKNQINK